MNCSGECISEQDCTESKTFVILVMSLFFAVITAGQCFYIVNRNNHSETYLLENNDIPPPYQSTASDT